MRRPKHQVSFVVSHLVYRDRWALASLHAPYYFAPSVPLMPTGMDHKPLTVEYAANEAPRSHLMPYLATHAYTIYCLPSCCSHISRMSPLYIPSQVLQDLLELAAKTLVPGGRLVFFLPTVHGVAHTDDPKDANTTAPEKEDAPVEDIELPAHPSLILVGGHTATTEVGGGKLWRRRCLSGVCLMCMLLIAFSWTWNGFCEGSLLHVMMLLCADYARWKNGRI